jgi:hypothetical protein
MQFGIATVSWSAKLTQQCKTAVASYKPNCPIKNWMTDLLPLGSIPVVILIRTDTTLDLSQKAEKV